MIGNIEESQILDSDKILSLQVISPERVRCAKLGTLNIDDLRRIVAGTFDLSKVPVEKHKNVAAMAAHCCLNGPVGTNKRTTFPIIDVQTSINEFLTFRVSNNSWKSFCRDFAIELKRSNPDVVTSSQQHQVAKDLWPLAPSISEYRANTSK